MELIKWADRLKWKDTVEKAKTLPEEDEEEEEREEENKKTYVYIYMYRSILLTMEIFQTKVVEETKTQILCYIKFFPKIVPFMGRGKMC